MPRTPAELRALAAHLKERALEHLRKRETAKALLCGDEAEDLLAEAKRLEGLTGESDGRRIRSMSASPAQVIDPNVKRGIGRATRKHPAQALFYKAGKSIKNIADELGENQKTVSSWMAKGDGNRAIPRHQAERLLKAYKVPLGAWQRIRD